MIGGDKMFGDPTEAGGLAVRPLSGFADTLAGLFVMKHNHSR